MFPANVLPYGSIRGLLMLVQRAFEEMRVSESHYIGKLNHITCRLVAVLIFQEVPGGFERFVAVL